MHEHIQLYDLNIRGFTIKLMTINLSRVTLDFDGCRLTSQTVSFRPT